MKGSRFKVCVKSVNECIEKVEWYYGTLVPGLRILGHATEWISFGIHYKQLLSIIKVVDGVPIRSTTGFFTTKRFSLKILSVSCFSFRKIHSPTSVVEGHLEFNSSGQVSVGPGSPEKTTVIPRVSPHSVIRHGRSEEDREPVEEVVDV